MRENIYGLMSTYRQWVNCNNEKQPLNWQGEVASGLDQINWKSFEQAAEVDDAIIGFFIHRR